eukprot:5066170-Amphidinium_carterae.1
MGSGWWAKMRAMYQDPDGAEPALDLSRLAIKTPPQPVFDHFKSLIKHPADRTHMQLYAKTTKSLSESELV